MNADILNNFLRTGSISIPSYFLANYKKLNITSDEFIILIYLMSSGGKIVYDPKVIGSHINMDEKEVLQMLSKLNEKRLIDIVVEKNACKMMEEFINLDILYSKIASHIMGSKKEGGVSTLFETFEHEFGRTLSPMEYEIISAWINAGFKDDIILEALREATYNGVSNLRYIDKIIYEWKKKGFKSVDDIRKYTKEFKKVKPEKKELFDYNWLEDEE